MHENATEPQDRRFQEILKKLEEQDREWERLREKLAQVGDVEFAVESPLEIPRPAPVVPAMWVRA